MAENSELYAANGDVIETTCGSGCSVSTRTNNAAAVGFRARAHTSAYLRECMAFGTFALAETDGDSTAVAFGTGARAVAYAESEAAIAIGYGVEAGSMGRDGMAIAISTGDAACVVSAGEGGRLMIITTTWKREFKSTFVADIDGVRFLPRVRYTVNERSGEWSEVSADDDSFADLEQRSQVEEAMARAIAL